MGELQMGGHWNKRIKWIGGTEGGNKGKELGLRAFSGVEAWCTVHFLTCIKAVIINSSDNERDRIPTEISFHHTELPVPALC